MLTGGGGVNAQVYVTHDSVTKFYQKIDSIFEHVDMNRLQTGYLSNAGFLGQNLEQYRGLSTDTGSINNRDLQFVYNMLFTSNVKSENEMPFWDSTAHKLDSIKGSGIIPIPIILWEYDKIKDYAIDSNLLSTDSFRLFDVPYAETPFETQVAFAMAPWARHSDTGNLQFVVPSSLIFTNLSEEIISIEVDFGDGLGFQELTPDVPISISYDSLGAIDMYLRVYTESSSWVVRSRFFSRNLWKRYDQFGPPNTITWYGFTAEDAYNGWYGMADVTISYGCGNGNQIRKPLIVVPGFDPKAFVDLNGEEGETYKTFVIGLPDDLRTRLENGGYDLVYINYRDGGDYIQRNARLVESVIRRVNQEKVNNGSNEPTTVLGVSMGGIVARYALAEMEQNSETHNVEEFISFDSPHNGANVPLGFQAMFTHIYGITVWVRVAPLPLAVPIPLRTFVPQLNHVEQVLACPAALQMLEHHYYSSDLKSRHSFRNNLLTELDNLGWPQQVSTRGHQIRNAMISNGTNNADNQGYGPNSQLLSINATGILAIPPIFTSTLKPIPFPGVFHMDAEVSGLPDMTMGIRRIYRGSYVGAVYLTKFFQSVVIAGAKTEVENTPDTDNAPGGYIDLAALTAGTTGLTLHQDKFNFIPSVSSAALKAPYKSNLYYNTGANWNPTTKTWANNESYADDYTISEIDGATHVPVNSEHYKWTEINRNFTRFFFIPYNEVNAYELIFNLTFNYARGTSGRIRSCTITNTGAVKVNANESIGKSTQSPPHPLPVPGSLYQTRTSDFTCFGTINILVESGGLFQVGDNATSNKGSMHVMNQATLEIGNEGILRVDDNSKLVIEPGGALRINPGAVILLQGENAVIEIKGRLELADGAVFSFSKGSASIGGYIKFDLGGNDAQRGIFAEGSDAKILLSGNNIQGLYYDKVLEITGGNLKTPDAVSSPGNYLDEFSISGGSVYIDASSSLKPSVSGTYYQNYFIGNSTVNSIGLNIPNPDNITISYCAFKSLGTGLNLNLDGFSGTFNVSYSSFKNCLTGLAAADGQLKLQNCSFGSNDDGLFMLSANNFSEAINTSFSNNENGIKWEGSSNAHLYVQQCDLINNVKGAEITGADFTASCTRFKANSAYGVDFIGNDVKRLNISPLLSIDGKTGGNCLFENNNMGIKIGGEIYLDEGDNIFHNTGGGSYGYYIQGAFPACNPCNFMSSSWIIPASDNYWNPAPSGGDIINEFDDLYHLRVSTFPHPAIAKLSGSSHSTYTSNCFETAGSSYSFIYGYTAPYNKKENDIEIATGFLTYPNPAASVINIKFTSTSAAHCTIQLRDITGRIVGESMAAGREQEEVNIVLNIQHIPSGIYLLSAEQAGNTIFMGKHSIIKN